MKCGKQENSGRQMQNGRMQTDVRKGEKLNEDYASYLGSRFLQKPFKKCDKPCNIRIA